MRTVQTVRRITPLMGGRWSLFLGAAALGIALTAPVARAEYLTGSRGPEPVDGSTVATLKAAQLPPTSCGCTAVAELRAIEKPRLGQNNVALANEFVVQVGRFPGNATGNSWIRVQAVVESQEFVKTQWVKRRKVLPVPLDLGATGTTEALLVLENWSTSAVDVTLDTETPAVTLKWRRPTVNTWVTATATATMPWTTTKQLQLQARNTHALASRLHLLILEPLAASWSFFQSGGSVNPFKFAPGGNIKSFTVAYTP